jgi:hypothetical protein
VRRLPWLSAACGKGNWAESSQLASDNGVREAGSHTDAAELQQCAHHASSKGHSSTAHWATTHGVIEAIITASAKFAASITAKWATGNEELRKGPLLRSILTASRFRTRLGLRMCLCA